jgi:hypothetical protein
VKLGTLVLDASALAPFLVDAPRGAMRGKLQSQDGVADAVTEVEGNQPTWGAQLGVAARDVDSLDDIADKLAQIAAIFPAAQKLVELLDETRITLEDQRERVIRGVSDAIDGKRKQKDLHSELQAAYEKTLSYRSRAAKKGAATRSKNKTTTT